jgi:hypothetical protein
LSRDKLPLYRKNIKVFFFLLLNLNGSFGDEMFTYFI